MSTLTGVAGRWHFCGVSEQAYPVTVGVRRADGSVEQVRVGTAVRAGDGFRLTLGELSIGGTAEVASAGRPPVSTGGAGGAVFPPYGRSKGAPVRRAAPAAGSEAGGGGAGGMVFPPYGRSKGQPVAGASAQDLEFYASGCRRSLADPAKSRWHDKERVLLAAIEAEMAKQRGGGGFDDDAPPPRSDDDMPF